MLALNQLSPAKLRRLLALCVFSVSFAAYLKTLCPTVYTMDNAELTVAVYTLGVAHPTGYPLFCLLGKLFTLIVPFGEVVYRINVMNAIFGALTGVFLFVALNELTKKLFAPFAVALLFGLSRLFWDVSSSGEVYALGAMFVALNLFLLIRWTNSAPGRSGAEESDRKLYPLAFFGGLSLTNHMTSAFVLIGAFAAVMVCDRGLFRRWRTLLKLTGLFAAPLSLYLYLPLRAHPDPAEIWNNIFLTEGFFRYVTGTMYRSLMFSMSPQEVWANLLRFTDSAISQFPLYLAWMLPFGVVALRRSNRPILAATAVLAVVGIFYCINYDIADIDAYYLPAMLAVAVLIGAGLDLILETLKSRQAVCLAVGVAVLAAVALGVPGSFRAVDKSDNYAIKDYADNLLTTIPKHSLLIACGDSVFNGVLYDRVVHNNRPDVIILERNVVRTWRGYCETYSAGPYVASIVKRAPDMARAYYRRSYSWDEVYDETMLAAMIAEAVKVRPVYFTCIGDNDPTHPIMQRIKPDYRLWQEGIAYRILPKSQMVDKRRLAEYNEKLWSVYRLDHIYDGSIQGGVFEREIPDRYSVWHTRLGELETDAGMFDLAARNYRMALAINNRLILARDGLALALAAKGNVVEAMREWRTVLQLAPNDQAALHNLQIAERKTTPIN